jgi:hypothetical protein
MPGRFPAGQGARPSRKAKHHAPAGMIHDDTDSRNSLTRDVSGTVSCSPAGTGQHRRPGTDAIPCRGPGFGCTETRRWLYQRLRARHRVLAPSSATAQVVLNCESGARHVRLHDQDRLMSKGLTHDARTRITAPQTHSSAAPSESLLHPEAPVDRTGLPCAVQHRHVGSGAAGILWLAMSRMMA